MSTAEAIQSEPFKSPPEYKGIKGYMDEIPEEMIKDIVKHYMDHSDKLHSYRKEKIDGGADPSSPELVAVERAMLICDQASADAEQTDPSDGQGMFQINLKYIGVMHEMYSLGERYGIVLSKFFSLKDGGAATN
jgi:hypothetical protein